MEVENSSEPGELLEIGDLPKTTDVGAHQVERAEEDNTDSDSEDTLSTISSPSNYFSGPSSSVLLAHSKVSPQRGGTTTLVSDLNPTGPLHSLTGIKMADSGYYDASLCISKSETDIPVRGPLSVNELKYSPTLSTSPEPAQDHGGTPGEDHSQHVALDEVGSLLGALQSKCSAQEEEIKSLRSERIKETVATQMSSLNSILAQQEELQKNVHQLNRDLARKKDMIVHLEGKISFLESQSPRSRPPSRDKDSSPGVKYFPGRWTAYRAESKKYSEEMNIICEALEGEGYGPSQVSADEVVRHLWWQRENLRKSGGVAKGVSSTDSDSGDLSKQFEKYETKLADLEENLAKCKDDLELREKVAKETESLLKRQIEENLISRHEAEGEVSTLKGKMAALEQDNILLREKINHLRLEILEYSTKTAKHIRDLASLKREKSSVTTELGVLKTEKKKATTDIASLRSKLEETEYNFTKSKKETFSIQQELEHAKQSLLDARDELSTASTEITASKAQCDGLKAKVDNLEEERSRREKWLKELQEDASTLRAQLREKEESRLVVLDKERQLSAELEGRNKQLIKLEHEKRMIEEKVAASQRELDSRTSELQEKENKVWELSRENSLQADELAELNSKLERLKLDKAHTDKELQEVSSDLSHVKVKAFEMEQRLCTKTEEVDNLFGKNERLGAKLSMLEDDKLSLSQELAREKHNLTSAKEKCGSFERELESIERKHRQEMETQVAKCNHLVMRLSEAQKVCDLVGGENQELQKQIEEMEQSLADSDMQVKKSQEEYLHVTEGLQQQLRTVTEEYNHYQNTSKEIKMELSRKNNDFEAKILALGAELRQRDSTIDVMSSESVGLQSRITALTEDMSKLSEAKSELETRLRDERDNAVGSVRRAEEEVEIQKQHVVNLKEDLVVAHAASQNIQLKLDHALEENQTLASRLRDAEDKALIVEAEKEELDVQWNKTNKELQQERLNHKEDIAHFEDNLDDIRRSQEREKEMFKQETATLKLESQSLRDELSLGQQQLSETRRELERVRREVKEEKMKQEEISTKHQMESRKTEEERDKLKKEIRQEATNLKLSENKVKQLELSLQTETQSKMKVQEELQHVQRSKTQLEMDLETEKEKVFGLSKLKAQLEGSIERESVRIRQLNQEVDELVAKSRKLERQLQEEREANELTARKQSKELHDHRSKYHDEKKALKERIKQLNKECEGSKLQCQQLVANVASLESAHSILSSEKLHLTEEVARRDELVSRLKEEVRLLEMRNNEFDSQVNQLKKEVSVLQRVHIEFEEYKKRLDSTSKAEMQRILSEVTHHMEQQYVAHRNLDKLRLENEGLSLRQKDRKIDKLRNDLKKSQLEGRHDRLHLESLELEADMLRSQKKELDRSRRKLESRLEKINNSLSQSLQEASARNESLTSHVTSTPYSNPPSRQRSFLSDIDSHLS